LRLEKRQFYYHLKSLQYIIQEKRGLFRFEHKVANLTIIKELASVKAAR